MKATQREATIVSLRANVSESEAMRSFSAGSLSSMFWRLGKGQFKRIASAYVPFCLYRSSYEMSGKVHTRYFALDQVQGSLDLFEFPTLLGAEDLTDIKTRNHLPAALDEQAAESLLREKVLRLIFQRGFFQLRRPNLQIERNPL